MTEQAAQTQAPQAPATGEPPAPAQSEWEGKYQGQLKVNRDLEAKLADQRAESERLAAALQEATSRTGALEVDVIRWKTGVEKRLSFEDVETFLTASDPESLAQQGERLAERFAAAAQPGTPRPDPTQAGAATKATAKPRNPLEESLRSAVGLT